METWSAISFAASVVAVSAFLFLVTQAIISPRGWTKKDGYGVAVRFKVFLPLYLQKPEKWKLMPDKARYDDNMTVYFSSGLEWHKYNRWLKRKEKERLKREQEERKQRFHEMIFKDYQTGPNPEFAPPPTVKSKTAENGEDYFIVRGGIGNKQIWTIPKPPTTGTNVITPKPRGKLANAELDKIRADGINGSIYPPTGPEELKAEIKRWADGKEWGINPMELAVKTAIENTKQKKPSPRCRDCKHFMLYQSGTNIRELCGKHRVGNSFEQVWSTMTACGAFEQKAKYKDPLETVQTYSLETTEHYE